MRDRIFSGNDVTAALVEASRTLGVPAADLRYVVLDAGSAGRLGMSGRPAQIAVLLDPPPAAPRAAEAEDGAVAGGAEAPSAEAVLADLARAAGVELGVEREAGPDGVTLRLSGPGCAFLLEPDGRVLEALEHLLQRAEALRGGGRLRLACEGYRERREQALRDLARELAEAVRGDGELRQTRPLNSYERRIVHVTIGSEPGVTSYSQGEGAERRVTVAPAAVPGTEAAPTEAEE